MKIAAVVLAGGDGDRIGGAKPARMLAGRTLLDHALGRARGAAVDVAVALRRVGQLTPPEGVATILDEGGEGPLAGLAAGLRFARLRGLEAVLTLPCDTPFVPLDLAPRLTAALTTADAAVLPTSGGRLHPACGLWRTSVLDLLPSYRATGRSSLRGFAGHIGFRTIAWPDDPFDPFFNINDATDLAAAEARARQGGTVALVDGFGRRIDYVRLSVTDRCDLRCRYCMPANMRFLPRQDLLTMDELAELADALIQRGVRRIRLTGGEPLVRRGVTTLVEAIGRHLGSGLDELTVTTNGTRLAPLAGSLAAAGVNRVNVSLDSLDADRFRAITRLGNLDQVLAGITAARAAGMAIKINMVALKGLNEDEFATMVRWCGHEGHDLTFIETMPLGEVEEDRTDRYIPLDLVQRQLEQQFTLVPSLYRTGGPARYYDIAETGGRIGFITPLTRNFCNGCNRIRITATGTVFGCLGHNQRVELREAMRSAGLAGVHAALDAVMAAKPKGHAFDLRQAVVRHMSVTGG